MDVSKEEFRELSKEVREVGNDMAGMQVEVRNLNRAIGELVSKAEFFPVKAIAYGLAAGALGAVVTAVISNVIIK